MNDYETRTEPLSEPSASAPPSDATAPPPSTDLLAETLTHPSEMASLPHTEAISIASPSKTEGNDNPDASGTQVLSGASVNARTSRSLTEELPATLDSDSSAVPSGDLHPTLDPSQKAAPASANAPTNPALPTHDHLAAFGLPAVPGYEVLKELGHGGMGVVYLARHKKLNRLVALKMIRSGQTAGPNTLRRFYAEAEAVARFQHPSIVQVYEIGQFDGLPYFALEYIDGGSLLDRTHHKQQLPHEAAIVVQRLAEAMDYAHRNNILHRDLKPANILMARPTASTGQSDQDELPLTEYTPKITDFGLAKQIEGDAGHTREGAVMGTPSYMAPEQAQGMIKELTAAADVYALGAILYELLTAVPPFQGTTAIETLSRVVAIEPLPPRRLQPNCPRDLQTICLKCLEKEPKKRYVSAAALAEDLRRYSHNEPILARPTPAWERAWKWARRRPAAAALTLLSGTVVLGLSVGGMVWAQTEQRRANKEEQLRLDAERAEKDARAAEVEATRLRDQAEEAAKIARDAKLIAERQRQRAEENFHQARAAVEDLTFLGQEGLENEPRLELIRGKLLRKALAFHREFLRINGDLPTLRLESALAQHRVGEIEALLGQQTAAEAAYREAIRLFDNLLKEEADSRKVRLALATTWFRLAALLQVQKRSDEAATALATTVALRERVHAEEETPETTLDVAATYNARGDIHYFNRRPQDAEKDYLRALPYFRRLLALDPNDERYGRQLAQTLSNLGAVWMVSKKAQAEQAFGEALPLWQKYVAAAPESQRARRAMADAQFNRGNLRYLSGRLGEAETDYQAATTVLAELADQYRRLPDYRLRLANADENYAELLREVKKPLQAEKVLQRLVQSLTTLTQEFPQRIDLKRKLGRAHDSLAMALWNTQRTAAAEKAWREAVAVLRPLIAAKDADPGVWQELVDTLYNMIDGLTTQSPNKVAEQARRDLIDVLEQRAGRFPGKAEYVAELAAAHHAHAELLRQLKEPDLARRAQEKAIEQQKRAVAGLKGERTATTLLSRYCLALLDGLLEVKEHAAVGDFLKANSEAIPSDKAALYLARCVRLSDDPQRQKVYADAALDALQRARKNGLKDYKTLQNEAFAPLRERADFQELLKQLQGDGK